MSNYESEYADLILPSVAVVPLKTLLRTYTNDLRTEVRDAVTAIHNAVGTRSRKLYEERVTERDRGRHDRRARSAHAELVEAMAYQVLWGALYDAGRQSRPPRHPTVTDLDKAIRVATNKTSNFQVYSREGYSEATISFGGGRKVRWEVGENNHAVDHAHQAELAGKFFAYLDKITWTRGTGGVGLYRSEYDDDGPFGFSHSLAFAYGPEGEKIQAQRMGMSLAQYRTRFRTATRRSVTVAYR
jgi:hypothetical protein